MVRVISWFSCGAASAVATKLALERYENVVPVRIIVKDEHEDNERFANDCEKWFGVKIHNLINDDYEGSVDKVIEKRKYMAGVDGAPCTMLLKKEVRKNFQTDTDSHVFGFHLNEEHRINQVIDSEPELNILTPLIDDNLTKNDCFEIIKNAGIKLPYVYSLGFPNANCIGCVKSGGVAYWNLIKKHFPKVFEKRAKQEQLTGALLCKVGAKKYKRQNPGLYAELKASGLNYKEGENQIRLPLNFIPDTESKTIDMFECGILCELKN